MIFLIPKENPVKGYRRFLFLSFIPLKIILSK